MRNRSLLFVLLFISLFASVSAGAKKQKPQAPVKVACVGNSITFGYGLPDREKEAYPVRLQEMLGPGYDVRNFGKSGATLLKHGHRPYIYQTEYADAKAFAADIVVMHLGINDTDPRNWPNYRDEFIADYRALIDTFRMINPKCRVMIALMTPLTTLHHRFESGTRDWHDEENEAIRKIAKGAGVQLFDLFTPLYCRPELFADAVHPNAEGEQIIANVVYSAITGDYGGLQMPVMYSDNMMLQYGKPIEIAGTANTGDKVSVSIADQKLSATADADGHWSVTLSPLVAGGHYSLSISTQKESLTYNNVLAGDIWLCSGQSNMEFKLSYAATAEKDIPQANRANIRLYNMDARWRTNNVEWEKSSLDSINQLLYLRTDGWTECNSETARAFSAIAYYFGKELNDSLNIPVGLICNAVGGSTTESWVDRHSLEYEFPSILRDWLHNDYIQDWARGRAAKNIAKSDNKLQRHPYQPCYLFEAGILPLQHFPIKGVIWYQGESNAHNKDAHAKLFNLLVNGWREYWQQPDLPFYYVQLSSLGRPSWPWFRDSQRLLLSDIDHAGMAVCSDVGDRNDVHPKRKTEVGHRLALWALNQTYGKGNIIPSGPLFNKVSFSGDTARVTFDYGEGLQTSDGQPIRTFELSGEDGLFYPADAQVIGNGTLLVRSAHVKAPVAIRYGWQPYTEANLINAAGLPASTFRSDSFIPEIYRTTK